MTLNPVCVVCLKEVFEETERNAEFFGDEQHVLHFFHDDDCPNHLIEIGALDAPKFMVTCQCDNPCHAACCPVCKKEITTNENQPEITEE